MKMNNKLSFSIFRIASGVFAVLIVMLCNTQPVRSAQISRAPFQDQMVIEHIRISVPKAYRDVWLDAEKETWAPWLSRQSGFLGRELYWDPREEEATILITWSTRKAWKAIPNDSIQETQEKFEDIARDRIGLKTGNPFPLEFEGELLPQ